ncbi:Phosphoribosylaminoimidazole carboxylase [Hypoxylon sp. NC1633]|nr:Phosphoribosylaminoimidazole carboxylase [Hypoxylon sp. NC1633]
MSDRIEGSVEDRVVGVLGGGQYGRLLSEAAGRLSVPFVALDPSPSAPAKQISAVSLLHPSLAHVEGSYMSSEDIQKIAERVDILTVEIEHVDVRALFEIRDKYRTTGGHLGKGVSVVPSPETIAIVQDKLSQKQFLRRLGVPVADFVDLPEPTVENVSQVAETLSFPLLLKARRQAYDGRGNFVLRGAGDAQRALDTLRGPLYAERYGIDVIHEIVVVLVRSVQGDIRSYGAVENVHAGKINHLVRAPLRQGGKDVSIRAQGLAEKVISALPDGAVGVFGVELFLLSDGSLLVHEITSRPHSSAHYTVEASETSQYENHPRAILSFPLGSTALKVFSASTLNFRGTPESAEEVRSLVRRALETPGASAVGKADSPKGRKIGHITVVGPSDADVNDRIHRILGSFSDDSLLPRPPKSHPLPLVSVLMGSDSDLPSIRDAARILDQFKVPFETRIVSAHRTPTLMNEFFKEAASRGVRVIIAGAGGAAHLPGMIASESNLPVVGVPVKGPTLDGVPVATVGINNSTNAALLAIRILAVSDPKYAVAIEEYRANMEKVVLEKGNRLNELGWLA